MCMCVQNRVCLLMSTSSLCTLWACLGPVGAPLCASESLEESAGYWLIFNSAACMPGGTLYQNREAMEHGLLNFKQTEQRNSAAHSTMGLDGWHQKINLLHSVCRGVIGILNRLRMQ